MGTGQNVKTEEKIARGQKIMKVGNWKNKTTFVLSDLKVEFYALLVFSISNFFSNKNSQERKSVLKIVPTSAI